MKRCNDCRKEKPLGEFTTDRRLKDGRAGRCKECQKARVYGWRRDNRERHLQNRTAEHRRYFFKNLHKRWGLTREDWDRLLISQSGRCPICERQLQPDLYGGKFIVIDHCHDTGRVRGLLCSLCNKGIGCLRDDPVLLKNAVTYLQAVAS